MNSIDWQYFNLLSELINSNVKQQNRTGVAAYKIPPRQIQAYMGDGCFPILTTKKMAWKTIRVELEGFIKGVTSKKWFQERGCRIWDEWCNPKKVPYGNDEETKARMAAEDDLGPCIYGAAWRDFHHPKASYSSGYDMYGKSIREGWRRSEGVDQLANIVETLKTNPEDRRMICLAWNPLGLDYTALPACHYAWQVTKRGEELDLTWTQRSVDVFLGLPFNIASYGLLLHLLCLESGFKPGYLTGNLTDVHLYENHFSQACKQLMRDPFDCPSIVTKDFVSIFDWDHKQTRLVNYEHHDALKGAVAV